MWSKPASTDEPRLASRPLYRLPHDPDQDGFEMVRHAESRKAHTPNHFGNAR